MRTKNIFNPFPNILLKGHKPSLTHLILKSRHVVVVSKKFTFYIYLIKNVYGFYYRQHTYFNKLI